MGAQGYGTGGVKSASGVIPDIFIPSAYQTSLDDLFPGSALNANMTAARPASVSITGNVLSFSFGVGGAGYSDNHIYYNTQAVDQKATIKVAAGATITAEHGPMVRRQGTGSTGDCYLVNRKSTINTFQIYKIVGGVPTLLVGSVDVSAVNFANGYYCSLEAIGIAPTLLVATLTDLSGNHIATTTFQDNSASLQLPGRAGYASWTSGSVQISEAIIKQRASNAATGTDVILCVGDSITAGSGTTGNNNLPFQLGAQYTALTARPCTIINQGVSAKTSADWGNDVGGIRTTAIAAANAKGAVICSVMLGTNDSKESVKTSTAAYLTNLQNLCAALFAGIPTLQAVVLHKPIYHGISLTDFQGASLARLMDYNENLFSICTGSGGKGLLPGDSSWFGEIAANPTELGDNIHPGDVGAPKGGKYHANSIYRVCGI